MVYTSYFAKIKTFPANVIPVAICGKSPDWYNGLEYKKLAPKYSFFKVWKETQDNDYYVENYNKLVLDNLSAMKTAQEIHMLLPYEIKEKMQSSIWLAKDYHIVLLCYEKPDSFCHRHLVAKWFNENGFPIEEWQF
jgi:hypothetical protein